MNVYDQIHKELKWLEENRGGNLNIVNISRVVSSLSLLSVTLGEEVSNAYALQNELEDEFDGAYASKFAELKKAGGSDSLIKSQVEAELIDKKKDWTAAKNGYQRLKVFLDRLDKVLDANRQLISVNKLDSKGI